MGEAEKERGELHNSCKIYFHLLNRIGFGEIMGSDRGLLAWLEQLNIHGASLVTAAPAGDATVVAQLARLPLFFFFEDNNLFPVLLFLLFNFYISFFGG